MTQTQIPPGGMVNRIERAYSKGPFIFISSNLKYQEIKIDALCSLLSRIQRLTTSLQQARIKTQWWGKLPGSFGSSKSRKLGRVSFSFLLDLLENSKQLKSNVPKHTLKVFWVTTLVTKKIFK